MKNLIPKLFFIIILLIGISSFVVLKNTDKEQKANTGNSVFNSEMDNGFSEREVIR